MKIKKGQEKVYKNWKEKNDDWYSRQVFEYAEAYANRKLVQAGLTPQEKAKIEMQTRIGVAAELAKTKWPTTYISGGSGSGSTSGGSMLTDLIGADMAKNMLKTNK